VILIIFGILVVLSYTYCFFCMPSKNKRKIYAMMKEAKLENEGHG
jgi:phage shock protein PspC (stress-responsive transcriptional regulator)